LTHSAALAVITTHDKFVERGELYGKCEVADPNIKRLVRFIALQAQKNEKGNPE